MAKVPSHNCSLNTQQATLVGAQWASPPRQAMDSPSRLNPTTPCCSVNAVCIVSGMCIRGEGRWGGGGGGKADDYHFQENHVKCFDKIQLFFS